MTKVSVELIGSEKLAALFNRAASKGVINKLSMATFMTAEQVLKQSQIIVPVDVGTLRDSKAISAPKVDATGVEVEISYGGKARAYALFVHEDPDARHKDGETYHYLKIPVDAARKTFVLDLKKRFLAYLRQGT